VAGEPAPRRDVLARAGVAGDEPEHLARPHSGQPGAELEDEFAAAGITGVPELISENPVLLCGIQTEQAPAMGTQSIPLGGKRNRARPQCRGLVALATAAVVAGWSAAAGAQGTGPPKQAAFELRNEVTVKVPEGARRVRVWMAMPQDNDPAQQVRNLEIEAPYAYRVEPDSEGSRVLYLEIPDPKVKEFRIVQTFGLTRAEIRNQIDPSLARSLTSSERQSFATYLAANKHILINDSIRRLANEIVGSETNPVLAARLLYDWVLYAVEHWVKDPRNKKASPVGSTAHALTLHTGDCGDFASLWTSLARAKGIPTQIVYGALLKPDLAGRDADQSVHCWTEFYAPGIGWLQHDVAIADIYEGSYPVTALNEQLVRLTSADGTYGADPTRVDYYFGNLDERRVVFSRNRDLVLSPRPEGEPVNALPKAYIEVDGKTHPEGPGWTRKLTYREP
jgi:transglutaminase-like putative cysteine protease